MAVYLYFLADVISIFILIGIIYETRKHNESIYVLCGAAITVVNFGYWQLASAANLEEALLVSFTGTCVQTEGAHLAGLSDDTGRVCGARTGVYRGLQHDLL